MGHPLNSCHRAACGQVPEGLPWASTGTQCAALRWPPRAMFWSVFGLRLSLTNSVPLAKVWPWQEPGTSPRVQQVTLPSLSMTKVWGGDTRHEGPAEADGTAGLCSCYPGGLATDRVKRECEGLGMPHVTCPQVSGTQGGSGSNTRSSRYESRPLQGPQTASSRRTGSEDCSKSWHRWQILPQPTNSFRREDHLLTWR